MPLNNGRDSAEILKNYLKITNSNENENTTHKNSWNTAKAALREKLIMINAYISKRKISNESVEYSHLRKLEN